MTTYKFPAERQRPRKRFLTARDIEDMAEASIEEIVCDDDLVITHAARETAIDLGIRIVSQDEARLRPAQRDATKPRADTAPAPQSAARSPVSATPILSRNAQETRLAAVVATDDQTRAVDDALVRAIVDAIRERWRSSPRYPRQLLPEDKR